MTITNKQFDKLSNEDKWKWFKDHQEHQNWFCHNCGEPDDNVRQAQYDGSVHCGRCEEMLARYTRNQCSFFNWTPNQSIKQ